jgi:Beta-galactosidase
MKRIGAACLFSASLSVLAQAPEPQVLFSFETDAALSQATTADLEMERLPGDQLRLTLRGAQPRITLTSAGQAGDWRPYGAVALQVINRDPKPLTFTIEVKDAAGATTKGTFRLRAEGEAPIALPLDSPDPLEMGMRGPAAIPHFSLASPDYRRIDLSRVNSFTLRFHKAETARKVTIGPVRLISGITYDKIVDPLGQFALDQWPGKVKDESEFTERRAGEESAIAAAPRQSDRDEYGGWASGPTLKATGFFRAAKQKGKWWLVTPSGHLFLSFGLNSITTTEGDTIVEGRERMFDWLPAVGEPLASHYGENREWEALGLKIRFNKGKTFNFYASNLERKYGKDWYEAWKAAALARLPAWGYNTIGNWSDPQLYAAKKVPYTATVDPWPAASEDKKAQFAEVASGNDYWKRMADPFDPRYARALEPGIRDSARKYRDDPWCLGYFVDNEMSWGAMKDDRSRYGLSLGTLALTSDSPAKRAFVEMLKHKYADVARLNEAWGGKFASWQELLDQPYRPAGALGAGLKEDLRVFSKEFAKQYFRTVIGILKKYDPNHMYLGPRFAWHTRESVEACGELCDVVSFNIYRPKVVASEWTVLEGIDKPVLIGEFHMGALDRGMFHTGLVPTEDQADRAHMYQEYIRSVVDHPLMVGCHYFKYADEPLTGRPGDGENYNIGIVSVTDTPYPEFLEAAKAVHAEAYQRRSR